MVALNVTMASSCTCNSGDSGLRQQTELCHALTLWHYAVNSLIAAVVAATIAVSCLVLSTLVSEYTNALNNNAA
jgi:ABC-type Fe3+ transport system permease subunit